MKSKKFCINIIHEKHVQISRGTAQSSLEITVLETEDESGIKLFSSYEEAEDFIQNEISEHIYSMYVVGFQIVEFISWDYKMRMFATQKLKVNIDSNL